MSLAYRTALFNGVAFSPRDLFRMSEQGWLYDATISDLSGLFQDSAGTIPVTAVEQPVGLMLDLSGRGNHATQATSAARPTLSARYNGHIRTQEFDNAAWEKLNLGSGSAAPVVTANAGVAPDGSTTADRVQLNKGSGTTSSDYSVMRAASSSRAAVPASTSIKSTIKLKSNTGGTQKVCVYNGYFQADNVTPGGVGYSAITEYTLTTDWQTIEITDTTPALTAFATITVSLAGHVSTVSTADILVWGADLRVANDGVNLPAYQRVNTATDYDTAAFPLYLRFDGSDDFMVTGTVDLTATDKFSLFTSVRKLSDAALGTVVQHNGGAPGSFGHFAPEFTAPRDGMTWESRGSGSNAIVILEPYAAPYSYVFTGTTDLAAPLMSTRINGGSWVTSAAALGGNFSSGVVHIGRITGTIYPLNGRIYFPFVGLGRTATAGEITNMETYLNTRNKVY
jgi:hypothetical protein